LVVFGQIESVSVAAMDFHTLLYQAQKNNNKDKEVSDVKNHWLGKYTYVDH